MNAEKRSDASERTSDAMLRTIAHADALLGKHEFDVNPGLKKSASPKRSASGLYYLDCVDCGRTVFENGTGSATDSVCSR